jgi:hypothetical protein
MTSYIVDQYFKIVQTTKGDEYRLLEIEFCCLVCCHDWDDDLITWSDVTIRRTVNFYGRFQSSWLFSSTIGPRCSTRRCILELEFGFPAVTKLGHRWLFIKMFCIIIKIQRLNLDRSILIEWPSMSWMHECGGTRNSWSNYVEY